MSERTQDPSTLQQTNVREAASRIRELLWPVFSRNVESQQAQKAVLEELQKLERGMTLEEADRRNTLNSSREELARMGRHIAIALEELDRSIAGDGDSARFAGRLREADKDQPRRLDNFDGRTTAVMELIGPLLDARNDREACAAHENVMRWCRAANLEIAKLPMVPDEEL